MADPITSLVFTAIQATSKLAVFILELQGASEEIRSFARLLQHINEDRTEVLLERQRKLELLKRVPLKLRWIESILRGSEDALNSVAKVIENAHAESTKYSPASWRSRMEWVLSDKGQILVEQHSLSACHLRLSNALGYLHSLDLVDSMQLAGALQSDEKAGDEQGILLSPMARRPRPHKTYQSPDTLFTTTLPPSYEDTLSRSTDPQRDALSRAHNLEDWVGEENTTPRNANVSNARNVVLDETMVRLGALTVPFSEGVASRERSRWRARFFETANQDSSSSSAFDDRGEFAATEEELRMVRERRRQYRAAHFAGPGNV